MPIEFVAGLPATALDELVAAIAARDRWVTQGRGERRSEAGF